MAYGSRIIRERSEDRATRLSRRAYMRFTRAIDLFIADLESAKKSPATIHGYRSDLLKLAKVLTRDTVLDITAANLREAMRFWSSRGLAQNTLFRRQTAIRTFCRWGRKQRLWLENPTELVDAVQQAECLPRPFWPFARAAAACTSLVAPFPAWPPSPSRQRQDNASPTPLRPRRRARVMEAFT